MKLFLIALCLVATVVYSAPADSGSSESALDSTLEFEDSSPVDEERRSGEDESSGDSDSALDETLELDDSDSAPEDDDEDEEEDRRKRGAAGKCSGVAAQITDLEKEASLTAHNNYRGDEKAENEFKLSWDDELASRSQQWADKCIWEHGMTTDCTGKVAGQNMWIRSGGSSDVDMNHVVRAWANEKAFYHFDTRGCDQGKMCGHYTQVVWAKTKKVGCGISRCDSVAVGGKTWKNAIIVVCDYSPAGNYRGQFPFSKGVSCAACEELTGGKSGWMCEDNLCAPCTPESDGDSCQCTKEECQNGGTFNDGLCTCDCPAGYYGARCEKKCECADNSRYSRACRHWAKRKFCTKGRYQSFMKKNCAKTCDTCVIPEACK